MHITIKGEVTLGQTVRSVFRKVPMSTIASDIGSNVESEMKRRTLGNFKVRGQSQMDVSKQSSKFKEPFSILPAVVTDVS